MVRKWGRRKSSSSATKHSPSKSHHVFPISWLSKLKQKSGCLERKPAKGKGKEGRNSNSKRFPWPESWRNGRFCEGDDDLFWRLSFGEERFEGETSRVGLKSGLYDSDDEFQLPVFGTQDCESNETMNFNEMVFNIRKLRDSEENRRELERESDKADGKSMAAEEKDIFELEPRKRIQTTERNCLGIEDNCEFEALSLEKTCGYSEEPMKIKDLMSKTEKQRTSVYISKGLQKRRKQSGKARVTSSPRTAIKIECKIRALEDKKRGKFKKKEEEEEGEVQETSAFDQFAVVKCSYTPEEDFRDSMVAMIREKGIRRPEELEELLACYLTLNSDEYHDLIIKVFRQVWFDLEGPTRNSLI